MIWWAIFQIWTYWKFFRVAFPVCPGLTPLRRKLILGGIVLMNVVAYSLYGLSLAGQAQWRIQMMIGRALQCTACFGIINVIPFLHKNAWSQTPSKTRNEFAWLLICTINYVAFGVEFWSVCALQLSSRLQWPLTCPVPQVQSILRVIRVQ